MEIHLQLSLLQISSLLEATQNEPRLKGPFPIQPYRTALVSCQNLLDLLTSMRTVTSKDAWFSQIRKEFVEPVNLERREMVGTFSKYSSLLKLMLSLLGWKCDTFLLDSSFSPFAQDTFTCFFTACR